MQFQHWAFRRVYSAPGLDGAAATIVGGNFSNPSGSKDQGYIYIEGWPAPNTTDSETGIFLNSDGYNFFYSTPTTGLKVSESPAFPVGDSMLLLVSTCGGTQNCIAITLWDATCGQLGDQNCTITATPPSNGWSGDCCILARMSTIGQPKPGGDNFTDGSMFGPTAWSGVQQSTGSNPNVPFVSAGYQDFPNNNTKIIVNFTDADDETDTINLHK